MRRLLVAVVALASGSGCAVLGDTPDASRLVCRSDEECGHNEVCFADGCGDPGQNIAVEVRPNPLAGQHEQDYLVENLRPRQNLELFSPSYIEGQVLQLTSGDPLGQGFTAAYTSPISVRITGESLLIPGLARHYEGTVTPNNGSWRIPVGTGHYTVTLMASDATVPPLAQERWVEPGRPTTLDFVLPASSSLTRLTGTLVRQGKVLVDADMEVQALDANLQPLSQRVPLARPSGEFALVLPPEAANLSNVLLQVTKQARSEALVPQKTFSVDPRKPLPVLELGDYGDAVKVRGRVVDSAGHPVAGASVYMTGKVGGGGTFRSATATTDADGQYTLRSLPSSADTPLQLYAVPLAGALAGLTRQSSVVPRADTLLQDVRCPDKVEVRGLLQRPEDATPAAGVRVSAEPVGEVAGWPQPAEGSEVTTDADGQYILRLDPGEYRFDFSPAENLPRVSRFVTVRPSQDAELAPFTLSKGRRISGEVTMRQATDGSLATVPYANIRFFRVVNVEGKPTSVLLAQTTSDSTGTYSATLPTR